jgi:hypothetical protein
MVHRITYLSSSAEPFPVEELESLLQQSQRLNSRDQISGLLIYHSGSFIQVIEGPRPALGDAMSRIRVDRRHHGVIVVEDRDVETREFVKWNMAFQPPPGWQPNPESAFVELAKVARLEADLGREPTTELSPYMEAFIGSFREFR